jgi:hypothetical protein
MHLHRVPSTSAVGKKLPSTLGERRLLDEVQKLRLAIRLSASASEK